MKPSLVPWAPNFFCNPEYVLLPGLSLASDSQEQSRNAGMCVEIFGIYRKNFTTDKLNLCRFNYNDFLPKSYNLSLVHVEFTKRLRFGSTTVRISHPIPQKCQLFWGQPVYISW